jgi:hypothetical protein
LQRQIVLHTDRNIFKEHFTVQELLDTENALQTFVQHQRFFKEIQSLNDLSETSSERGRVKIKVNKYSSVYCLDRYLSNGLLRVGG